MTKLISFVGSVFVLLAVVLVAVPASSYAANYAYVNAYGNVSMFTADNATIALRDAPNMDPHSGVILLLQGTSL